MKHHKVKKESGDFSTLAGAIFIATGAIRSECFKKKLFGLPSSQSGLVKRIKAGMILFLFDYDKRMLFGVFGATSDGTMNIMPNAFASSGMKFPAQVQFKIIWKCNPLKENEFRDSIKDNYFTSNKFNFDLSHEQVVNLIRLFSAKRCNSECHHVHLIGKQSMKLQGNYDPDMENMTHQNFPVEFDESENNIYNNTDSIERQHIFENKANFSIFSESHFQTVDDSQVCAPSNYAADFCASQPHISKFADSIYRNISNSPGYVPTSSPHLRHDYHQPRYLHEQLPIVSGESNPSLAPKLTEYTRSAMDTNSQHLGLVDYLPQRDSRTKLLPTACVDTSESIRYRGCRGLSNPTYEYSPTSLTFAGHLGYDSLKISNYESYSECCNISTSQDDVSSPRMLLTRGTNSLTPILGASSYDPCCQSSLGMLLTGSKMSNSSGSPESRQTKESSRVPYSWHDSHILMPESKNVINFFESSNVQRNSCKNSTLLPYNYQSTSEDKDASLFPRGSEKNSYLLNFTDKVHNDIHHYHTAQDEQEAYTSYSHCLLGNHHRKGSVFSRLSNIQKTKELEDVAHDQKANPSVDELVESMRLRRKKWITPFQRKKTFSQASNKAQEFVPLEDPKHDPETNPSVDKLAEIMELHRKKWGNGSSPLEKTVNQANGKPHDCLSNDINLTGKQLQECLSREAIKQQECVSPEKLDTVNPLTKPKPEPKPDSESVLMTVELPFVNFRRKSDVSKISGETKQTAHKKRKLVRPSLFIHEDSLKKRDTGSPKFLSSSEETVGGRSLLGEEIQQSNLVVYKLSEGPENTASGEHKHENLKRLAKISLTEEATLSKGKHSDLLESSEEVDYVIGHKVQKSLPLGPVIQTAKSNLIDGRHERILFRTSLSEENGPSKGNNNISNIPGSSEDVTRNGSLRVNLEVQKSQIVPLIKRPKKVKSLPWTTKKRRFARPSSSENNTSTTGDINFHNGLVPSEVGKGSLFIGDGSQRATYVVDLMINCSVKTEAGEGTHKGGEFVMPCNNEDDKLNKRHSKCPNILCSSEVVDELQRSIPFNNPVIKTPENTENGNVSHFMLGNRDFNQLMNVQTSAINEHMTSGSNELGPFMTAKCDKVVDIVEKLEETRSNLVDRSGTETNSCFSDGSQPFES